MHGVAVRRLPQQGEAHVQPVPFPVLERDIPEHQDGAGGFSVRGADRRGAVGDVAPPGIPGNEVGVIGRSDGLAGLQRLADRGGDAAAVQTADDMEDVVERSAERFGGPAAGQFARDRVDHGDAFPGVGHDHSVADGLERQGEAGGRVGGFLTGRLQVAGVVGDADDGFFPEYLRRGEREDDGPFLSP